MKRLNVYSENTPLYLIAFAIGNLVGPLVLGHFFDTIGRRNVCMCSSCHQRRPRVEQARRGVRYHAGRTAFD